MAGRLAITGRTRGGHQFDGITMASNADGRLELFTVSLLPHFALWHRSQLHPGQDQWTGWSSLGWPAS